MESQSVTVKVTPECSLTLQVGDITKVPAGAIVNAANSGLRGGGGVDGAIHKAGGPTIMEELDGIRKAEGGCPTGSAVVTGAGRLPASFVFHAVGPIYSTGSQREEHLLASCYRTCLELAAERGVESISFPSISTGAYSYPLREASRVALGEVLRYLRRRPGSLKQVSFVLFDKKTYVAYSEALDALVQ